MGRPTRFTYGHAMHHVTLRCNNREFLFADPDRALLPGLRARGRRIERSVLGPGLIRTDPQHGGAGAPNSPRRS